MKIIRYVMFVLVIGVAVMAGDLSDIKHRGVLRHLGVPYANFVTGSGDGLSVDMMKLFAKYLGVKYKYVKTDWSTVLTDLTGIKYEVHANDLKILSTTEQIKGDVISNGLTVLPWRQKLVNYSKPTFPSQVWLITRATSPMKPITPTGDAKDIEETKKHIKNITILSKKGTCLDPSLYQVDKLVKKAIDFKGSVNDLAPAVIKNEADATLLEIPDILTALQKWPGKIKVIGPISKPQNMGVAFRKSSTELKKEFDKFYAKIKKDGTYMKLINKYYPSVFKYYKNFFKKEGILH